MPPLTFQPSNYNNPLFNMFLVQRLIHFFHIFSIVLLFTFFRHITKLQFKLKFNDSFDSFYKQKLIPTVGFFCSNVFFFIICLYLFNG